MYSQLFSKIFSQIFLRLLAKNGWFYINFSKLKKEKISQIEKIRSIGPVKQGLLGR